LIVSIRYLVSSSFLIVCCKCSGDGIGTAFLGAGARGRVFRVKNKEGQYQALKVVVATDCRRLLHEYALLDEAANAEAPSKVAVFDELGGGYLLSAVGKPVDPTLRSTWQGAFSTLQVLHEKRFTHGDARLPNLLQVGDKFLWIDFLDGERLPQDAHVFKRFAQNDMLDCVKGVWSKGEVPAPVVEAIAAYDLTSGSVGPIISAVWEAIKQV
jgi:hypothetical protein